MACDVRLRDVTEDDLAIFFEHSMRVLEKCGFTRCGEDAEEYILMLGANNG